jgi:hypothetical protein
LHLLLKKLIVSNKNSTIEKLCLQSHRPPGLRVATGEIINKIGNTTGQLDVAVVNDDAPLLNFDTTVSPIALILAGTILCLVEVKLH